MFRTWEEALKELEGSAETLPEASKKYSKDKREFTHWLHIRRMTLTNYVARHENAIKAGRPYIKYLYQKEREELSNVQATLNRLKDAQEAI